MLFRSSPSNGKPIIVPSQDIVLGLYYLSQSKEAEKKESLGIFSNIDEIEQAIENKSISLHTRIISIFETVNEEGKKVVQKYTSTAGRFILANLLPKDPKIKFSLIDRSLTKKNISEVIDIIFRFCGQKETVIFCDRIKSLGFKHAFKAGISFGKDDLVIPDNKQQLIDETKKLISDYENQYAEGLITREIGRAHV